jgi:nucleoside-diphosphate-sugar epimerase
LRIEPPLAITGGTGFVGKAVCRLAAENSVPLRALARKIPDDTSHPEWIEGDLASEAPLNRLCEGASAVIHIAGLTNTPDPAQFEEVNVVGTANVIAAAKAANVRRLILVSSLSARKPELSQYGASKAKAEELVKASGLDWTIVRPPAVYGPHDIDMFELFRSAKWGFVPLPPGGATSIIHVDDLARLLLAIIPTVPAVNKHVFEPDDGREGGWSHKELGAAIGRAMRRKVFAPNLSKTVLEAAARLDRLLRGKRAKLTQDRVGYMCHPNWVARFDRQVPAEIWQPRHVDEEGLQSTAQWYRENRWL